MVAQNAYAGMASSIAGTLQSVFGKSKAFAVASALINTYESVTKALAAYPPPFSYVAAAASLAAGLAQVANIRKTSKSGGGGGSAATTGAGAASSTGGGGGGGTPRQSVSLNLHGQTFGRDQVVGLIGEINEAVKDGAVIHVQ